ncbi:hypothetical protein DH2020_018011 [Rehmannia glutinosa]|uniref:Uncharacterized protein n=1 Tax=Rehmannia glutinosa TaxID=99300 RepID=A0ABR0WJ42_REHGL
MFKLHQRPTIKPSRPRERVDFKFSNFQALQVPKGWDRLFVSLISVETGKTIAKLGKALGSARSSTLGEATINVAHYTSSRACTAISQPLKKCSYGTILQVKIQCLNPRSKTGDEQSRNSISQEKDRNVDNHNSDIKSHKSDKSSDSIVGHLREDLATTSSPLRLDSKEASQSASGTTQSFDSLEGSIGKENISIKNAFKSDEYNSSPSPDYNSVDNISPSNHSSLNTRRYSRDDFQNEDVVVKRSSTTNFGSSKHLLEAAEDSIEELRAEAKMWERNARKLMYDLDLSRKEFSDLSKKQKELVMELSAAYAEQDGIKREVEKLKLDLEKLTTNQSTQDSIIQSENLVQIQKELENEIKYQQALNDNLGQQLKQSQESNIELVSVLQELEETIKQQKIEIEDLSSLKIDFTDFEKKFQADVELLEEALRDKSDELENERVSNRRTLLQVEKDYEYKISAKEEEIASLEATLSGYVKGEYFEALDDNNEIETLREKIRELEKDCAELTDENLELLFKLKDSNKTDIRKCASFDSMSRERTTVCPSDESEVISDSKFQISHRNELESTLSGLQEENVRLQERVSGLEAQVRQLKDENGFCQQETDNFRSVATSLQDEIEKLKIETDVQTFVLKQQLEVLLEQLLGARDECEYLKEENTKLQNSNSELMAQLSESKKSLSDCTKKLESLEDRLNSETERVSFEASSEVSRLLADKANLQASLQEVRSNSELAESKIQDLTGQLACSKQNQEKLMSDHERILKSLANYKRSEEKLKTDLNDLELKHTISEYERQQLTKEMSILKVQLGKLELALQTVSGDYEKVKAENISLSEKISVLQGDMCEFDECKRKNLGLEEKLLEMEKELTAKEIMGFQNNDLKNELIEIKRENAQFQTKLYRLEEEKIECLKKAQALEEELELLKERNNIHKEGAYNRDFHDQSPLAVSVDHATNRQLLENERANRGEVVERERYERTNSSLETELRDLRERYLEMSLKYAEVESQREDLVMKLKTTRNGKRWFF